MGTEGDTVLASGVLQTGGSESFDIATNENALQSALSEIAEQLAESCMDLRLSLIHI